MRILDPDRVAFDPQDPVRDVAELKDIALQALDREVFIYGADELRLRFEDDAVVGCVGDGPAGGQGGQASAAPAANQVIDGVVVDERSVSAAPRGVALGQHQQDFVELLTLRVPVGVGASDEPEQACFVPFLRGDFGHDLLRHHIQGFRRHDQPVQLATAYRVEQGDAFDQVIP